ncbi:MAG: T9SS type A sorting domain-containing protein, partial [Bacteroidota bacterium]|nr:T9SS type A sorting domain-containing protein [Bacteroidota bacterium]
TWTRIAGINNSIAHNGRYPSMAISNSSKGDISKTTGVFSWPQLNPGSFGFLGYGADQPLGSGSVFAVEEQGPPTYSSQVPCWADDATDNVFWCADNTDSTTINVFSTTDFNTVDKKSPWLASEIGSGDQLMGGAARNGVQYIGVLGTFETETPFHGGWSAAYAKSTDQGATWSHFKVLDWRKVPALAKFDVLFDSKKGDAFVTYNGDINVDRLNRVHLLLSVRDTTTNDSTGNVAVIDVYEDPNGNMGGNIVAENLRDNAYTEETLTPSLGQMGPCTYLATDQTGDVLLAQWIQVPAGLDSAYNDVFVAVKSINDAEYSTPVNLTNTPNMDESSTHLAPMLKTNGNGSFTAFTQYTYGPGETGPRWDPATTAVSYVAPYTFNATVGVNEGFTTVNSFTLDQNYPNPFNPSTIIKYTLAEKNNVSLKVYDMLGREVASLVNGLQDAGAHQISFNGKNLSSGMYIYTIKSGNFTQSKKMLLMK